MLASSRLGKYPPLFTDIEGWIIVSYWRNMSCQSAHEGICSSASPENGSSQSIWPPMPNCARRLYLKLPHKNAPEFADIFQHKQTLPPGIRDAVKTWLYGWFPKNPHNSLIFSLTRYVTSSKSNFDSIRSRKLLLSYFLEFHKLCLHPKIWADMKFLSGVTDIWIL